MVTQEQMLNKPLIAKWILQHIFENVICEGSDALRHYLDCSPIHILYS